MADSNFVRGSVPDGAEAARNYSEGLERLRTFDTLGARELLRNAVNTAPAHALSHAALAAASGLLGYDVEARDEAKKALDLSAGLGREEHLSIEGRYFETTHAWDKAVVTYQTLRTEFPDNLEYGLRLAAAQTQAGDSAARHTDASFAARSTFRGARSARRSCRGGGFPCRLGPQLRPRCRFARRPIRRVAGYADSGGPRAPDRQPYRARIRAIRRARLSESAQSQQLYLAVGHRQGVAWALNETAGVLTQRGDVAGARARYEEALAVCRTIGDQSCIGTDLDSLGVCAAGRAIFGVRSQVHQEALESRRSVGDRAGVATSLYNLGNVLEIIGDLPRAHQATAESLEIRQQLGERRSAALTMSRLANIRRREGDLNEALGVAEEAVTSLKTIGDRGGVAMAQFNLGLVLFDRGDLAAQPRRSSVRRWPRGVSSTIRTIRPKPPLDSRGLRWRRIASPKPPR